MKINKWYTISEYVDTETGEIITKQKFETEYYKTKINKKIEINENYGTIRYIHECKRRNQLKLEFRV